MNLKYTLNPSILLKAEETPQSRQNFVLMSPESNNVAAFVSAMTLGSKGEQVLYHAFRKERDFFKRKDIIARALGHLNSYLRAERPEVRQFLHHTFILSKTRPHIHSGQEHPYVLWK